MRSYQMPQFAIGDRTAYAVQFLRSIGESHSRMARARGTITGFVPLGTDTTLAEITWDRGQFPGKVNTANLAKIGPNPRFCNVD